VITPTLDGDTELAARLDRLPATLEAAIRAALVQRTAGVPPARFRPPGGRTAGVPPAISAAIATALQQVLNR
jgi:hypothetical protein